METKKEMMGVTFQGSVTFQGPMFDIHDNQHVTIVSREHESAACADESSAMLDEHQREIIEKLRPIFYGIEEEAKNFLLSIQNATPRQIADMVNQMVKDGKISELSSHRPLWKVLHDCGLYDRSESNWNTYVK